MIKARGDQIGQVFEGLGNFWQKILAPKRVYILGYFCLKQFFYIFALISSLKALFSIGILRSSEGVWCRCFGLSNSFDVDILSFLGFCNCFGYFFQNLGNFLFNPPIKVPWTVRTIISLLIL